MRLVIDIDVEGDTMMAAMDPGDKQGYVELIKDIATDITDAVNELQQPWTVRCVSTHAAPKAIDLHR